MKAFLKTNPIDGDISSLSNLSDESSLLWFCCEVDFVSAWYL